MKKLFFVVLSLLIFLSTEAFAGVFEYKTFTASGLVTIGRGVYHGIKVNTDATNAATIVVYDNTSAAAPTIDPSTVYVTSATLRVQASGSNPPRPYYNGLYLSITCAGTVSVTIEYTPE